MKLTRTAAVRVNRERRIARLVLDVVVVGSGFEDRATVHGGDEKEGRDEEESRFHGG